VASVAELKIADRQRVLESIDLQRRLDIVLDCLLARLEVLRLSRELDERTKANIDQRQREYLLREQLKSIQKELGEGDAGNSVEIEALRKTIAEAGCPRRWQSRRTRSCSAWRACRTLRRSTRWCVPISTGWSSCHGGHPNRIESRLPKPARSSMPITSASTRSRSASSSFSQCASSTRGGHGPILCFVGPPGVGKTSLGQSIARALGRKFVRASLGGVHDEAEIRGHRRTYIGALPGNIIQAIRKAGSRGCVMMLDEIDKLGAGIQGDPSAALLEVLDPEQNNTFRDNYLALPFDLSRMLFITTANVLDNIPGPLRDRMEIIQLPGYTQEEKLEIARRYLVGRQIAQNGLKEGQIEFSEQALVAIIRDYTREAGVRSLEREIGAVCRRAAVNIAEGRMPSMRVDEGDLASILGPGKYDNEVALRTGLAGVATGLAWTPVGGDILFIEASRTAGDGKLILTGQLGEVMKESAQAALTLVKTRAADLGIDAGTFERSNIHVHVPAGAIPKDGPSAGWRCSSRWPRCSSTARCATIPR
jgi:ATP-dependent Lon protease